MELFHTNIKLYSYVIIFSYSMANYDIHEALNKVINDDNIKKVIIITAKDRGYKFNNAKISLIYYDNDLEYEKSYVSYKGIYMPVFLFAKTIENVKFDLEKLRYISISNIEKETLDVFYDKSTYPIAQLIERHFAEIGITTVRIHEKKDFSHGRMNAIKENDEIIYIKSDKYDKEYEGLLLNYIENVRNCKILNKEELEFELNYFEKLIFILNWILECSNDKGISIREKEDTKEDKVLFKYGEEKY